MKMRKKDMKNDGSGDAKAGQGLTRAKRPAPLRAVSSLAACTCKIGSSFH